MDQATFRTTCRGCGTAGMEPILTLGRQLVTGFNGKVRRAPLELVICKRCNLVQLAHSVPQSWFREWYGYRSGINPSMVKSLESLAEAALAKVEWEIGDRVVDIGANDGTLLRAFDESSVKGLELVGFEPAQNLWGAFEKIVPQATLVRQPFGAHASSSGARIITAVAMFYDLEEPGLFLQAVRESLRPDGVFVVQMNGLLQMVQGCAFDNISHEHNCYYSLTTFTALVERYGFEVFDAEENAVNGGSFRAYLRKSKGPDVPSWVGNHRVKEMLVKEQEAGLTDIQTYKDMSRRKARCVVALRDFLGMRKRVGKIGVYGASTRGLVILEAMNLEPGLISCAAERNLEKVGMPYSGTDIQCVSEETARETCSTMLVLPYHFIEGILEREIDYLKSGGELVVPLPVPSVYYWNEGFGRVLDYKLV